MAKRRKKLKNMSLPELRAFASSCQGVVLKEKMSKKQIMAAIPWTFKDHEGGKVPSEEKPENEIQEPIEPPLKNVSILDAVKVKANKELRTYISMDGCYRYGLSDEQIERADKIIKKLGCTKPLKRKKEPEASGF